MTRGLLLDEGGDTLELSLRGSSALLARDAGGAAGAAGRTIDGDGGEEAAGGDDATLSGVLALTRGKEAAGGDCTDGEAEAES